MNSVFDELTAKFYFCEILLALKYLHDNDIIYRDVKPENILLDIDGHIWMTDFGLCKRNFGPKDWTNSFCGSPEYMSPEMLKEEAYSWMVDFYSLGAMLFEMLTGLPPLFNEDRTILYENLMNKEVEFPDNLSPDAVDLLKKLLNKNPHERIGSENGALDIMSHPFCSSINFDLLLSWELRPPILLPSF